MKQPPRTRGMRHVAMNVTNLEACEQFYTELLGMLVEWRPDDNAVYLTSGNDNLALHRVPELDDKNDQKLDHLGFIIQHPEEVDEWYAFLQHHNVRMLAPPRTHRDGARSFYCFDPAGTQVQIIYHPPIANT